MADGPALGRARTFAAEPVASRNARYFVIEWLEAYGREELIERVGLAISELAANAVLHTTRPFTVGLEWRDDCLRVELVDSAPDHMATPVPSEGSAVDITSFSETGRGLQIVGALANRWGVEVDPNVKLVWAEFDPAPPSTPSTPEIVDRRAPAVPATDLVRLHYIGLPVRAAIESGFDLEDATRDLQLIGAADLTDEDRRLLGLIEQSTSLRLVGRHAALHASSQNLMEFDVEVAATDQALLAMGLLNETLARRTGVLGRAGPSEEVIAFRTWLRDETLRQRDGAEPRKFGEAAAPPDALGWLLESASTGYMSLDADGTVLSANRALVACLGLRDAPVGRPFAELAGADGIDALARGGEVTFSFTTAAGSVTVNGRAMRDGSVTRVVTDLPSQRADELLHALQQTLIPAAPPSVPGLDVAAAYLPASGEVGGDFYDVFEVAANDWCVVLGDVSGKGVDAAIVTSAARHAVRSSALREPVPSGLMHALNRALVAQNSTRFCTVVLARLQLNGDSWVATLTSGGHPFPLLVRQGVATKMGRPGSLLGVFEDVSFFDVSIKLAAGDALVLFTDGIIEARNATGELFGDERLHDAIVHAPPSAKGIVDAVLEKVLAFEAGRSSDDIAVVVIRRSEL